MERSVRSNLLQKISSKGERKGLQEGSETRSVVWFEIVAPTKRQEAELEVAELKMLRLSLKVTRRDRIMNKHIRGTALVGRFEDKVSVATLRWCRGETVNVLVVG